MSTIRWIFGIPLAFLVHALINIISNYFFFDISQHFGQYRSVYDIYYGVFQFLESFAFVTLSCFFIPTNKKLGALIAVTTLVVLSVLFSYLAVKNGTVTTQFIVTRTVMRIANITGLCAGFYSSYEIFKNKGWNMPKNPTRKVSEDY